MTDRLLVVDDEPGIRDALKQVLEYEGITVRTASSGGEAITMYGEFRPQVVFLDVKMAGLDGLETLTRLREEDPGAVVVMISGHGTIATAIEATRRGAFDFLEKPLDANRLIVTVRNALAHAALSGENQRLRSVSAGRYQMIGDSKELKLVREVIARVGPTNARVLISGENGTGKELVAHAIHEASPRRKRAFIEVNCAAIPTELIESELFGHVKGSFTGAVADREGKFEQADQGTLFLDEIGDMSESAQAKVLRVLQEGIVTRVGGGKPVQVDVRVITATNLDLNREIAEGRFREDLFYRLNVVPIQVPPLRERAEDIPALVAHFVRQLSSGAGTAAKQFAPAAIERLQHRPWPGNVRELRNAVERLLILAPGKQVMPGDVTRLLGDAAPSAPAARASRAEPTDESHQSFLEDADKVFILARLRENDWNVTATAAQLKIPRSALYKKMERYGISRDSK